jgi:hypothetical protein
MTRAFAKALIFAGGVLMAIGAWLLGAFEKRA